MTIAASDLFGVHEQALLARARRAELLASNLANADTPGYKARDVSFDDLLAGRLGSASTTLSTTDAGHLREDDGGLAGTQVLYRTTVQPTVDGNTVDTQVEQTAFLENALAYQASLTFLESRIAGLRLALRGE